MLFLVYSFYMEFENDLILAPMAGYSDLAFRILCEKYGASATISEMISAKALYYKNDKTNKMLVSNGLQKNKGVQIFGNDEIIMSEVIKSGVFDNFDFIDINMGCPAPKIIKNKEGSYLLKDINKASKIITSCVNSTQKPISVKFRMGFDENEDISTEFAKMCEDSGAQMITIHARTTFQKYSGKANLDVIKKVKDSVKIKVCGNGDVVDRQSYEKMKQTGVDYVMIGRGAIGNPYIFSEILGKDYKKDLLDDIIFHYTKMREIFSEKVVLNNMKKHLALYLRKEKNYKELVKELFAATTINKAIKLLEGSL